MLSSVAFHNFLSTHNALHAGEAEDDNILVQLIKLGDPSSKINLSVYPFNNVEMIKRLVIKKLHLSPSTNISDICIFRKGVEIRNHQTLTPYLTHRTNYFVRLQWCFKDTTPGLGLRKIGLCPTPILDRAIREICLGFQRGLNPKLTLDGTGGTYFLFDSKHNYAALFKPRDEEAFAPNNPRGYEGDFGQKGFRPGVISGEGSLKEVAAYLLDAQYGSLAGVPETTQVEACHPSFCYRETKHLLCSSHLYDKEGSNAYTANEAKTTSFNGMPWKEGSLQEYLQARDTCGDFNPLVFSVMQVHSIGILDIRLLNLDRNDGNILVTQRPLDTSILDRFVTPEGKISKYSLIPIDHGLILPAYMDVGDVDLTWYQWPQSKIPFSEALLKHIFELDSDRDASRLLRKLDIREDCLRTMRVATRVLQHGAKMHLNLYQIAGLVVRKEDFETPSILECAVNEALIQAYTAISASSLTQPSRLIGTLSIDLQTSEPARLSKPGNASLVKMANPKRYHEEQSFEDTCQKKHAENINKTMLQTTNDNSFMNLYTFSDGKKKFKKNIFPTRNYYTFCNSWETSGSECTSSISSCDDICLNDIDEEELCQDKTSIADTTSNPMVCIVCFHPILRKYHTSTCSTSFNISNILKSHKDYVTHTLHPTTLQRLCQPKSPKPKLCSQCLSRSFKNCHQQSFYHPKKESAHLTEPGTNKRRPTALRSLRNSNLRYKSSWTLRDCNKKLIDLQWTNTLLEKTFFECFDFLIKHYINEFYPDWKKFPFNGEKILQHMKQCQLSQLQRHRSNRHRVNDSLLTKDPLPSKATAT